MIDLIEIKGFKGINDEQKIVFSKPNGVDEGSGLNYIVGENCSGKSTIIEAINYVNVCKRNVGKGFVSLDNRFASNNYIMRILYQTDQQKVVIENNKAGENFANIEVDRECVLNDICYIQSKKYYVDFFAGSSFDNVISQQNNNFVVNRKTNENNMYHIINALAEIGQDKYEKEKFDRFIRENGFDNLSWKLNPKGNDLHNFDIFVDNKSYSYNLLYSGDGLITLLYLLIGLYYLQEGKVETLIVDEPEVSLHHQWILLLKKMFYRISKDKQIILVTHLPSIIDWNAIINGGNLIRVYKDINDKSNIRYLDDESKKYIVAVWKDIRNLHNLEFEGSSIFFCKDRVILCEGQDDVFGYKKLLKKHNRKEYNFFGWGVGGCSKIRLALQLFKTLGYEKVVAIYDRDQSTECGEVKELYKGKYKILLLNKDDIRDKVDEKGILLKEGILDDKFDFKTNYEIGNADYDYIEKSIFSEIDEYLGLDVIIKSNTDMNEKKATDEKNGEDVLRKNMLTERHIAERIQRSNVIQNLTNPFVFPSGGGGITKFFQNDKLLKITYISSFENDIDRLNIVLYLDVLDNEILIIRRCKVFNHCKTMTLKDKLSIWRRALKLRNRRI